MHESCLRENYSSLPTKKSQVEKKTNVETNLLQQIMTIQPPLVQIPATSKQAFGLDSFWLWDFVVLQESAARLVGEGIPLTLETTTLPEGTHAVKQPPEGEVPQVC